MNVESTPLKQPAPASNRIGRLRVSENRRFLVYADDGTPFFWLGDTAWELFHRCTLAEAELYLENRRGKGFNVIQAVALAELDGLNTPSALGERPLLEHDPLRPNERYFEFVDRVIRLAASKGMFIVLLPTWGDKLELMAHGVGPVIFNPANANAYGEWIGRRYRDFENIIWVNGGDRKGGGANTATWQALAEGIKTSDPNHLMTFHPPGGGDGHSSSEWFQEAEWLDFNLAQSGHERRDLPNYEIVASDYARQPVKPCLDGEPRYEDHAVNWKPAELGYYDAYDVRQAAYWAVFAGAFGHTYGCHPIWQFLVPGRTPVGYARRPWTEVLDLPGASQVGHVRKLMESRPMLTRVPDQTLVTDARFGGEHIRAIRGEGYGFIYLPCGGTVRVRPEQIGGTELQGYWYDPRSGAAKFIRKFKPAAELEFAAPSSGRGEDWVLVLEDAARSYAPPGTQCYQE